MFLKKIENRERAMAMYHEKITICVDSLNPKKGKGRIIHKMGSELRGELTFPEPNLIMYFKNKSSKIFESVGQTTFV